jgi:predicted adenylyl cyclase CyaB
MMNEIEVKYQVPFLPKVKKAMESHGFVFKEKHFERNFIFDTHAHEFKDGGKLLRIRMTTHNLSNIKGYLTTKIKIEGGEYKSNVEHEISIDQPQKMMQMFKGIFEHHFEYQKFRSTYYSREYKTNVCVDELPFGTFIEIESSTAVQLKEVIDLLKLKGLKPIVKGYPSLCGDRNQCYDVTYVKKAFGKKNVNAEFTWD